MTKITKVTKMTKMAKMTKMTIMANIRYGQVLGLTWIVSKARGLKMCWYLTLFSFLERLSIRFKRRGKVIHTPLFWTLRF